METEVVFTKIYMNIEWIDSQTVWNIATKFGMNIQGVSK